MPRLGAKTSYVEGVMDSTQRPTLELVGINFQTETFDLQLPVVTYYRCSTCSSRTAHPHLLLHRAGSLVSPPLLAGDVIMACSVASCPIVAS